MKISLTLADKLFSLLIRERAGHVCERCSRSDGKLDCSHHWSRRIKLLRFDPLNAMALCWQCHLWWHSNPGESGIWLRNKIGEEQYAYLVAKAQEPFKFDKAMQAHVLKSLKAVMSSNIKIPAGTGFRPCYFDFPNPYLGEVQPIERKKRKAVKKVKKPSRPISNPKFKRKVSGEIVAR